MTTASRRATITTAMMRLRSRNWTRHDLLRNSIVSRPGRRVEAAGCARRDRQGPEASRKRRQRSEPPETRPVRGTPTLKMMLAADSGTRDNARASPNQSEATHEKPAAPRRPHRPQPRSPDLQLVRPRLAFAQEPAPVLRGRALEIVDDRGKVRAQLSGLPGGPEAQAAERRPLPGDGAPPPDRPQRAAVGEAGGGRARRRALPRGRRGPDHGPAGGGRGGGPAEAREQGSDRRRSSGPERAITRYTSPPLPPYHGRGRTPPCDLPSSWA